MRTESKIVVLLTATLSSLCIAAASGDALYGVGIFIALLCFATMLEIRK